MARIARSRLFIIAGLTVVFLAFAVSRLSLYRAIGADDAYNLQIAESIGTKFCYCTRYRPERIFPVEESTNGIIQYVGGAFFALSHNPDVVKSATTAAAMLLLGAALLALDPWLVLLTALLLLLWYALTYVFVNFLGEPWAIAFSLLGIYALRRCDFSGALRTVLASRALICAIVCFGVAVESKLLAALVVVPVTWAISYGSRPQDTPAVRAARATCITAWVALGTALVLLLLVAFSVSHSMRAIEPGAIWQTFTGYVFNMVGQGQGQARAFDVSHMAAIISNFSSTIVLALLALSAAILLYANWAYAVFLFVTLAWWLQYGVNERHAVISLYVTIVLAGLEAHALIRHVCFERNLSTVRIGATALAALAAIVLIVGLAAHSTFYAPGRIKRYPDREHAVQTAEGRFHYSAALVNVLRRQRYVVASGWWQFPEITLREHLEFYDRMSPANAGLPRDQVVLLFDKGNTSWPRTSIRGNCDRVIYADGPLILCNVKRSVPISYQPAS